MKISLLKMAVLSALTFSSHAFATGFVGLPATGFASSAYTNCFNDGRTAAQLPIQRAILAHIVHSHRLAQP